MSDPAMDLLLWARGPGFQIAIALFLFGTALHIIEMYGLRRKVDHAPAKGDPVGAGIKTIFNRFLPVHDMAKRAPAVHYGGYAFHLGYFITVFLFVPHIQIFTELFGISWPGLPTPIIDAVCVVSLAALVFLLVNRISSPVRRLLSRWQEYLAWTLTVLPLLTGYMAFNELLVPYTWMLALHILSAELLIALFPFTRLIHGVTWVFARYIVGAIAGRKGVQP
jgi:nitrate reductase gamma subunit